MLRYGILLVMISTGIYAEEFAWLPNVTSWYSLHSYGMEVGEIKRELQINADQYQITTTSHTTGLAAYVRDDKIRELSRGLWNAQQIRPQHYEYHHQSQRKTRDDRIDFDWTQHQAKTTFNNQRKMLPISSDAQDLLSAQLALLLRLHTMPPQDVTFPVVDRGKNKIMRLRYCGEEKLNTPQGNWITYHFERTSEEDPQRITRFWFAKTHVFLLVAGEHQEPDGTVVKMRLKRVQGLTP